MRRAKKLWAKLGDADSDFVPERPKGMHWTSYLRLVEEAQAVEAAADRVCSSDARCSPSAGRSWLGVTSTSTSP